MYEPSWSAFNRVLGMPTGGFIFLMSYVGSPLVGQCWIKWPICKRCWLWVEERLAQNSTSLKMYWPHSIYPIPDTLGEGIRRPFSMDLPTSFTLGFIIIYDFCILRIGELLITMCLRCENNLVWNTTHYYQRLKDHEVYSTDVTLPGSDLYLVGHSDDRHSPGVVLPFRKHDLHQIMWKKYV